MMNTQTKLILLGVTLAAALASCVSAAEPRRHLLIVVDGLRPDYVTPDVMPNLTALGKRGVVFNVITLSIQR
jgi:hypothetical protein